MKLKQITGVHHILFNYKNGGSKELTTSPMFERFVFNDKGYVKSDTIEDLIHDENKVRPVRSVSISFKGETKQKFYA